MNESNSYRSEKDPKDVQ
ncbi:hypothetical protein A2U01_0083303, partial [Trifolium medium]|nr:hypothetical protein [Trifolium medium]